MSHRSSTSTMMPRFELLLMFSSLCRGKVFKILCEGKIACAEKPIYLVIAVVTHLLPWFANNSIACSWCLLSHHQIIDNIFVKFHSQLILFAILCIFLPHHAFCMCYQEASNYIYSFTYIFMCILCTCHFICTCIVLTRIFVGLSQL